MSKRILIVLAPTDYEIIKAESGEEALAAIAKQRPDLILMDIQLPIMWPAAMTMYRNPPARSNCWQKIRQYLSQ